MVQFFQFQPFTPLCSMWHGSSAKGVNHTSRSLLLSLKSLHFQNFDFSMQHVAAAILTGVRWLQHHPGWKPGQVTKFSHLYCSIPCLVSWFSLNSSCWLYFIHVFCSAIPLVGPTKISTFPNSCSLWVYVYVHTCKLNTPLLDVIIVCCISFQTTKTVSLMV